MVSGKATPRGLTRTRVGILRKVSKFDKRRSFLAAPDGLAIWLHREFEANMKSLLQAYHWLQAAVRVMPVASRWMSAGLLMVVVIGLVWTFGTGAVEDSEYLFGGKLLTESEADLVELAFSEAGLSSWTREGRRIRVPLINRNEYLSVLRESASLPLALQSQVQQTLAQGSPFESREQRQARESYAKAQDLGRKISAFPEVRWASVEYDRGERPGLSRSRSQSASVFVSPEGTAPLTKARVNMIRELVRASYAEMRSDDVVVIDTNASETDPAWEDQDPVLRKRLEEEKAYEHKVQSALTGYGVIRVTAHAELDSESTLNLGSLYSEHENGLRDSGAQGMVASVIEPDSLGTEPRVIGSRRTPLASPKDGLVGFASPTGGLGRDAESRRARLSNVQVKRIRVSVGLPASYYDKALLQDFLRDNPGKVAAEMPVPTAEMRQRKRLETESQIKLAVTPLLPASAPSDDAFPLVSVWDYPDLPQLSIPEHAGGDEMASWVSESWRILALFCLVAFTVAVPLGRLLWPLGRAGVDRGHAPASEFSRPLGRSDGNSRFEFDREGGATATSHMAGLAQATLADGSEAAEIVFSQTARQRSDSATDSRRRPATTDGEPDPFQFLSQVSDDILAQRVRDENPQTLAIILASLTPGKAARLLSSLGPAFRSEVMKRLAKLDSPSREVVSDIASQLRHRLLAVPGEGQSLPSRWESAEEKTAGPNLVGTRGQDILSSILAQMPDAPSQRSARPNTSHEGPLGFESIGHAEFSREPRANGDDPASADGEFAVDQSHGSDLRRPGADSRQSRSGAPQRAYDRLLAAPDVRLREALATVESRHAILALCGLPQSKVDAVLNLLSWGQARRARKQLSRIGNIELREIDQSLELVARQLDSEEASTDQILPGPPAFDSPGQTSSVPLAKAA